MILQAHNARVCSRCWQSSAYGLHYVVRLADQEAVMAEYDVCNLCGLSAFANTWRTFAEIAPLPSNPPWEYRLTVTPWYPNE